MNVSYAKPAAIYLDEVTTAWHWSNEKQMVSMKVSPSQEKRVLLIKE